jgi:hypothetical protein
MERPPSIVHPAVARNDICRKALLEPTFKKYVSVSVISPFHCYTKRTYCCRKTILENKNLIIYTAKLSLPVN